ncbi:hypothetical protein ACFLTT_01415 [Chloroflexota bacterium]
MKLCGVVDDKLLDSNGKWYDIANFQDEFTERSLIYSNGGLEVWE